MSPEGFIEWCRRKGKAGGKKSGITRKKIATDRTYEIQKWIEAFPEVRNNVLAKIFNVNIRTVQITRKLMKTKE